MKKTTLISVLTLFIALGANAQAELPNVMKINPISLAFGNFNLSYQRALSDASAIQIGANYWYNILGTEVSGVGLRGAYQFFITNRAQPAPEGFYIGPQMSINSVNVQETDEKVTAVGIGLMLGYQWVWKSGVTLDLGAGPMYQFANESSTDESVEGFLPNITIAVGYNF
ncbi:MAG: DUF3575 domain-containing protein [Cytophagales bacterium]|nr:DUF3575 domain-containing protein [Cytophagales bacterium]